MVQEQRDRQLNTFKMFSLETCLAQVNPPSKKTVSSHLQQPVFVFLRRNCIAMEQRLTNKPKFPSFVALKNIFTCSADEPVTLGVTFIFMFRQVLQQLLLCLHMIPQGFCSYLQLLNHLIIDSCTISGCCDLPGSSKLSETTFAISISCRTALFNSWLLVEGPTKNFTLQG